MNAEPKARRNNRRGHSNRKQNYRDKENRPNNSFNKNVNIPKSNPVVIPPPPPASKAVLEHVERQIKSAPLISTDWCELAKDAPPFIPASKRNIFGDAKPVDTAKKMAEIERRYRTDKNGKVQCLCYEIYGIGTFQSPDGLDGYRLAVLGYDYLALRALCAREIVGSVGNQIGVGKESDVYVGGDAKKDDLVLKFHRLGRTSFKKIKEKRDYHKKRRFCSWLYLSRIAALKEFTFLKALSDRKFPVPKPIDVCRHTVVMGLIDGVTLYHVDSVPNVGELYDKLIGLIMRLGRYGLIHGDFNEFNLMYTNEGEIIMIDFPQMVSIDHPNADYYFNRDVQCVRDFFRKKFNFDCEDYPKFEEVERRHNLDIELEASGVTKQMQLDLNQAYDKGNFDAHEDEGTTSEEDEEEQDDDEYDQEELEDIQEEVEEKKDDLSKESRFSNWIESAQYRLNEMASKDHVEEEVPELIPMDDEQLEKYKKAIEDTEKKLKEVESSDEDYGENEHNEVPVDDEDITSANGEKFKRNRKGDFVPRGKITETRSVYSTGSTIAPADVRKRLMEQKSKAKKQRLKVKGKQCAVQRGRKNNKDLIKEYAGWAF